MTKLQDGTNTSLAKALQAVIKEFVAADVAQSGNHCLRCALSRAHNHMEAVQETTANLVDFSAHNHRVGKDQPKADQNQA